MSSESRRREVRDPFSSITTHVYDARGNCLGAEGAAMKFTYDLPGRSTDGAKAGAGPGDAPPAPTPREPLLRWSFEFRLTGSERQERSERLYQATADNFVLVTECVRAYLTRGPDAAAAGAIGGVEVRAELRDPGIVCTARLSDLGPGDLVVVRVDLALYERG
jgi:hypothetical protein